MIDFLLKREHQRRSFLLRLTIILALAVSGLIYMTGMPGKSYSGKFQSLSESEILLCDRLKEHIVMLADRMSRVVSGIAQVVSEIADNKLF